MTHVTSKKLEQETEQSRERLSELLDELRTRVSPGEFVDQVYDYARDGTAGDMVRTLNTQVRNNPLATALIGAGIGWLIFSDRRARTGGGDSGAEIGQAAQDKAQNFATRAREAGSAAKEGAEAGWARGTDAAGQAYDTVAERAGETRSAVAGMAKSTSGAVADASSRASAAAGRAAEGVADGAAAARRRLGEVAERGRRGASQLMQAKTNLLHQAQEHPLVLASVGFALGAALGAAFPQTRTEDKLMGEASDDLKQGAARFGKEQYETAQEVAADVAERSLDEAKGAADEAGLVPSAEPEGPAEAQTAGEQTTPGR